MSSGTGTVDMSERFIQTDPNARWCSWGRCARITGGVFACVSAIAILAASHLEVVSWPFFRPIGRTYGLVGLATAVATACPWGSTISKVKQVGIQILGVAVAGGGGALTFIDAYSQYIDGVSSLIFAVGIVMVISPFIYNSIHKGKNDY